MKPKHFLWFTGIWTYPLLVLLFQVIYTEVSKDFIIPELLGILLVWVLPVLFPVIITVTNIERKQRGQTDFSFGATYGLAEKKEKQSKAYMEAAFPPVPKEYLSKVPTGLIVGTQKGKYAYCPLEDGNGINGMVLGNPGSGKSVLLLSWLYSMLFREDIAQKAHLQQPAGRAYNFFIVDIKGELFEKLLQIKSAQYIAEQHKDFVVVQPSNRQSYGWDAFYKIHRPNVSETEFIKAITDIADALVVPTGSNPYFSDNAKRILSGVLYYYAKEGWEFIPIIQKLTRSPLGELLSEVVADAENKGMGVVLDKLKGFVGKDDNESIADVETTMKTNLDCYSLPDVQWCLDSNPVKASPALLSDGETNMDLAIEESMLLTYKPLFRLITMQTLRHCESEFHEDDTRYTCLIFDEAARIGEINGLDAAMSTLRSKHTALICLFQSISQFRDIYPKDKSQTLLNLCELKIFLSGSGDKDTTDLVSAMAGEYEATKMSYKRKGAFGGKSDGSYSIERRPIVDAKAMMELREKKQAIAFVYGHYMRVSKLMYFNDPILAPIINEHKNKHNEVNKSESKRNDNKRV